MGLLTTCSWLLVLLLVGTADAYHFRPAKNWINDPNAPMYYQGWYHLFYQHDPDHPTWRTIVWGHSVSRDLINWVALEEAIRPDTPSDQGGCWSGSATILPDGMPVIMYTGVLHSSANAVQNVAYPRNSSDPLLRQWIKPAYNPVIVPEAGINATEFRDPTTAWRAADDHWRLLIGSLQGSSCGVAYVYRSRDFRRWTRARKPLHSASTGMWECPDLYPVVAEGGGPRQQDGLDASVPSGPTVKHVLKNSLDRRRYDYYTVGTYDSNTDRYVPDDPVGDQQHMRYDYGNFYASKSFYDPVKHRRIIWGWANESDTVADDEAKGWAGMQAIPRKVWLDPTGKQLMQWPVEELKSLRGKKVTFTDKLLTQGQHVEVTGLQTAQADVDVIFELPRLEMQLADELADPTLADDPQRLCSLRGADVEGGVGPFGLWVLASPKLEERTAVFFRVFRAAGPRRKILVLMCSDPTSSSLAPNLYRPTFAGFVRTDIARGRISLRTLIDETVVESFGARGRTCILSRVYPTLAVAEDARLHVFNNGRADVKVSRLSAWEMKKPLMNGA